MPAWRNVRPHLTDNVDGSELRKGLIVKVGEILALEEIMIARPPGRYLPPVHREF
jgi:hypothetical protein